MDTFIVLLFVIAAGYPVYRIRKDFLTFTFLSIFYFLFLVVPFYIILIEYRTAPYAYYIIEISGIFIASFYLTYKIFSFGRPQNTVAIFFQHHENLFLLYKYSYYPLVLGVILKIIGGDLIHGSIFTIPWQFPILYGIADRIYYLGVMISALSLYREGFNRRNFVIALAITMLSVLGGSRVTLLLPLAFLILLNCSNGNFLNMVRVGLLGVLGLFSIVFLIGTYRIDAGDRSFTFEDMHDLILSRISEFYWPASLIAKIESGEISNNIGWILTGLLGFIPALFGEYFLGMSVFGRDTDLMYRSGFGSEYMSVPLTPIGEGYYWFGIFGVILISIFFSLGFVFVCRLGLHLKKITLLLLILQLYRSAFALPVAAFPEFISFITKDILIDYIIVVMFWRILVMFNRKSVSKNGVALKLAG
jgi:hypothetical protein